MWWLVPASLALAEDEPISTVPASSCPDIATPNGGWPDRAAQLRASRPDAEAALTAHLFPAPVGRSKDRLGTRTDGVVIIHRGAIVYERYANGYTADTRHLTWSVSKSFTNALIGVAVGEGLSLEASVCDAIDAKGDVCRVQVGHLLTFSSGLRWRETYEGTTPRASSVLAMLYGEGAYDMAAFVAHQPLEWEPGTHWRYSSGDTVLLSAVARAMLEPVHGKRFPFTVLFDPIGMTSVTWEQDAAGTLVGSSYLWATPRDLARFGQFLLADGCWDGQRLLPEGWVAQSTEVSAAIRNEAHARDPDDVQGSQFWLNQPLAEQGQTAPRWPDVAETAFAALGHWKQSITVVPSEELVVVRTADDRDGSYDHNRTLALATALATGNPAPQARVQTAGQAPAEPSKGIVYDNSLFRLASGFAAKEVCSCVFVAERDPDNCHDWARVSPNVARYQIDWVNRTVTARALGLGKARAGYVEGEGCVRLVEP